MKGFGANAGFYKVEEITLLFFIVRRVNFYGRLDTFQTYLHKFAVMKMKHLLPLQYRAPREGFYEYMDRSDMQRG